MNNQPITFLITLTVSVLLLNCSVSESKEDLESQLIGEWQFRYEILSNGSKEYDNPYALLEFDYSDGFILKADNTGKAVWFESVKDYDFDWNAMESTLSISLNRSNGSIDTFEYLISDLTETSMYFGSPKGHKYFMTKK